MRIRIRRIVQGIGSWLKVNGTQPSIYPRHGPQTVVTLGAVR
jgi:hypothetical protein